MANRVEENYGFDRELKLELKSVLCVAASLFSA